MTKDEVVAVLAWCDNPWCGELFDPRDGWGGHCPSCLALADEHLLGPPHGPHRGLRGVPARAAGGLARHPAFSLTSAVLYQPQGDTRHPRFRY